MNQFLTPESEYLIQKVRNWEKDNVFSKTKAVFPSFVGKKESLELVEDSYVIGRDNYKIKTRIYYPKSKKSLPLILFAHGGGWIYGNLETHDSLCRRLSLRTGCVVLSIDYRLAPMHAFPTAINDFESVYKWALLNFSNLNILKDKIMFAGDSSGGNIAASLTCKLIKEKMDLPKCLLLFYPVLDVSFSFNNSINDYLLTKDILIAFRDQYINESQDKKNWMVSPIYFDELEKFPTTYIITAGCDLLCEESEKFAKKCSNANYRCFPGVLHGFMNCHEIIPESELALKWLSEQLSTM